MEGNAAGKVSVIVTTRNSARTLRDCLLSVREQTYGDIELIVVDNDSGDATRQIAKQFTSSIETFGPERSAQRNRGAEISQGDYIVFIDSDMTLEPTVVRDAVHVLRDSGMPAAIIPEVSFGEGFWSLCRSLERSCYRDDDAVEAARAYLRSTFIDAGGFDVALTGGEDWDLSQRVAHGRRLPRTEAVIRHNESRTRLREVYRKRRYYAAGYLAYLRKHQWRGIARGTPLRAAYARHWRTLASHPMLTSGMIVMKSIELFAVLQVAAGEALHRRATTVRSQRA